MLVFEGDEASLPKDKKQKEAKLSESLSKAASAIADLAKEAADVKTETLDIDQVGGSLRSRIPLRLADCFGIS